MVAVVNRRSGEIVDAECSMVTELARQFIAKLMIGYNLNDGLTGLLNSLEITTTVTQKSRGNITENDIFQVYGNQKPINFKANAISVLFGKGPKRVHEPK